MIVYLHIGTPKSGTTYVQDICLRNRDALAEQGVLWPGWEWDEQVRAVRDVLSFRHGGEERPEDAGGWEWFVDQVTAWDGRAVLLSMEWLVHATREQIEFIVGSLQPHEVRVVLTVRDLARALPAQWQEQMQNWATWSWEEYLSAVTSDRPLEHEAGWQFYQDHDLGRILRDWSAMVPVQQMTVVTVPARGAAPDLLWQRFAAAISVDGEKFDTDVPLGNASLGAASAELMRRINVATHEQGLSWRVGDPLLKWALAKGVLIQRRPQEPRLAFPAKHHRWAMRESRRLIGEVEAVGVPVIGTLADLMPDSLKLTDHAGSLRVTADELVAAAVDGIAGLTLLVGVAADSGSVSSDVLKVAPYTAEIDRRRTLTTAEPACLRTPESSSATVPARRKGLPMWASEAPGGAYVSAYVIPLTRAAVRRLRSRARVIVRRLAGSSR